MIRILSLFLAIFFLSACTAIPNGANPREYQTVDTMMHEEWFKKENEPIRTLTLAVFIEHEANEEVVRDVFEEVSNAFLLQVGVRLDISLLKRTKWLAPSFSGIQRDLDLLRSEEPHYDVFVGIALGNDFEDRCRDGLCVMGEAREWRNVVLRTLRRDIIIHEIGHTLLPRVPHSPHGVMKSVIHYDMFFTLEDRERIHRFKWRDFRKVTMFIDTCPLDF